MGDWKMWYVCWWVVGVGRLLVGGGRGSFAGGWWAWDVCLWAEDLPAGGEAGGRVVDVLRLKMAGQLHLVLCWLMEA